MQSGGRLPGGDVGAARCHVWHGTLSVACGCPLAAALAAVDATASSIREYLVSNGGCMDSHMMPILLIICNQ